MSLRPNARFIALFLLTIATVLFSGATAARAAVGSYTAADVNAAVTKGVAYIDSTQNPDGSFGSGFPPAETAFAIIAYGVLDDGDINNLPPAMQTHLRNAVTYLLSQQAADGSFGCFYCTYTTGLALDALSASGGVDPGIPAAISSGRAYLISIQNAPPAITGNPASPNCSAADQPPPGSGSDAYCGGWNYDAGFGRSDESNTGFALTGLFLTGGVPAATASINVGWQRHVQELQATNYFAARNDGGGDYEPGISSGGFSSNANNTGSLLFGLGYDGVAGSDPMVQAALIFGTDVLDEYELMKATVRSAIYHFGMNEDGTCTIGDPACDWGVTGDGGYHYSLWSLTKGFGQYIPADLSNPSNWYAKVVDLLLTEQSPNGSWPVDGRDDFSSIVATSFAVDALGLVGVPALSIDDVALIEGHSGTTNFTFTVTLSPASASSVTVDFATADGTAAAPGDYAATSGTLTFAPGELTKTITVSVNGDTLCEPDETFFVSLSNPAGGALDDAQGQGTIVDNDCVAPVLDHFKCYKTKQVGTRFDPRQVLLTDQFNTERVNVVRPEAFCAPADKDGSGISNPSAHLTCYKIGDVRGDEFPKFKRQRVEATDQFGTHTLLLKKIKRLCVPSSKSPEGEVPGPPPTGLDHFKCYKTKQLGTKFDPRQVILTDQFNTERVNVVRPEAFCVPVDKDGSGISDPAATLTCYKIRDVRSDEFPKFTPQRIKARDQFGVLDLGLRKTRTLCLPPPEPVRFPPGPSACVDTDQNGDPDNDDDALCDNWETVGLDGDNDGVADLQLYDLNGDGMIDQSEQADLNHKDIYLEIDFMDLHQPDVGALSDVIASFAAAPVPNPAGGTGIRLHIQTDEQALAHNDELAFTPCTASGPAGVPDFDAAKSASFGTAAERAVGTQVTSAKRFAFHYSLFVHNLLGLDGTSGCAEIFGNDFVVSLGSWTSVGGHPVGTRDEQAGTLMHEFGHNLNLRHGGADDINCKANYLSVMTYTRQINGAPISGRPLDYSRSALPTLDEASLSEPGGVAGPVGDQTAYGPPPRQVAPTDGPIDWNRDSDTVDSGVSADINNVGIGGCAGAGTVLQGHDDWANLRYDFQNSGDFADGVHLSVIGEREITFAEVQELHGID